ncbi:DUF4350 domain-containing protein [Streptomyces antimicrobicus]|uniref:DUF4350 domain-containing protein n=1 Tax=Streptomyces antimicrobicus TaxID=2883108 RepID=A0ABS8BFP1_9ACTN|nr:DUF4350 domain-containing protein [Streptomyces antimicrobicus]MCB5183333.1 DUF4350 domain-containing protein [Streptomyces antimicrobicus]
MTGPTHPAATPATAPGTPAPAGAAPGTPARVPVGGGPGRAATSTALTPAQVWSRARGFLLALTVLLVAGITLAALSSGTRHGHLDPRSADPQGSRAVAELLKQRGVTTRVVTTLKDAAAAAGPRTTLLVTEPDLLGPTQQTTLRAALDRTAGRTVLLGPEASLATLAPGVRLKGTAHDDDLDPGCALPAARTAGRATTGDGPTYRTDLRGATACYPYDGHPTLLVLPGTRPGGDTVLLGSDQPLLNENLADQGNASLALQLLGSRPELVWYLPTLADAADDGTGPGGTEEKSFFDLLPSGWSWALLQLTLAAVLAALWRARRLGPLVTERLPVVVRASEATEGRARLYRKAGARDRAATVLRAATRERLAAVLGVPATAAHDPQALLPAVAAHLTSPHHPAEHGALTALLFGPAPSDDAALVALADHLDALEREVRTS